MNTLYKQCKNLIQGATGVYYDNNYDVDRFGRPAVGAETQPQHARPPVKVFSFIEKYCERRKEYKSNLSLLKRLYKPCSKDLEWLYGQLADSVSKQWLSNLIAYHALGYRKIRLATNTPDYWAGIEKARTLVVDGEHIDLGFNGLKASKLDLSLIGYPIQLFFVPFAVHIQFVMEPYRCVSGRRVIEARSGDFVLDCGGCYGDTALYFAHKVGPQGKVFSFEFVPANLDIWRKNIELNPSLKPAIRLVEAPVSDKSGQELFLEGCGPGTRIVPKPSSVGAASVRTAAIDDVVERENLERVDFVKMDIEGSELAALQGAEKTLRKFRPTLAVSAYHNLSDFWTIPRYLKSLELGYNFYLRHFTIHAEETVLFAVAQEREQFYSVAP